MNPELITLEGDEKEYLYPNELDIIGKENPDLLGAVITGAKVGALAVKGLGRLFKAVGRRKRARIEKYKKKILAERRKAQDKRIEQMRFQQYRQRGQEQFAPGANVANKNKILIGAGLALALLMMLKK